MALTELIGKVLGSTDCVVEAGPVQVFAASLTHERDEFSGTDAVAPPTWPFVMPFWGSLGEGGAAGLPLDELRGPGRLILHGEQEFEFSRPVRVGDRLTGTTRVSDVHEKETGSAVLEFYVTDTDWRDESGNPVCTSRFTMIVRRDKEG